MQLCRPDPAYPQDTPISELRTAELFVLAAVRLWAAPHRQPGKAHPDWRGSFAAAGIEKAGMPGFDALLRILATAALFPLDVRCARCAKLGEDEAWMLQLVSLLQRDKIIEAGGILEHWLPRAGARIAFTYAVEFAAAMAGVGLTVPHRPGSHAATVHGVRTAPRLALVH
jgi:hypothetical protein